ncbi:MAG: phosphatase PAP2 family protein [Roseiflexaceae bacterium]
MDETLFRAINGLAGHNQLLDTTLTLISGDGPFVLLGVLALLWFWPGERALRDSRQRIVIIAVLSVAIALLLNQGIIHLWARPRPYETLHATLLLTPTHEPSFPSDHATFVFAIAVAALFASAPLGLFSLFFAVLIAFARVYTGQHYVSDVIGGAVIGVFCTVLLWLLRRYLEPLISPLLRFTHRLHLG